MKTTRLFSLAFLLTTLPFLCLATTEPIYDDFDDRNDDAWTRNDTLGDAGLAPPADYTFPNGAYRISGPGAGIQWARPMAFLTDVKFADFHLEVDVVDYSNASQNIGVGARLSQPGFGGNLGYLLNYHPVNQSLQIWLVTADHPSGIRPLRTASVDLGETKGFRLTFTGKGENLKGEIFTLTEPNKALATLETTDGTHRMGFAGLATIATGSGIRTDATFDNFEAYDPAHPPTKTSSTPLQIRESAFETDHIAFTVDGAEENQDLVVLMSQDLDIWSPVTITRTENILSFQLPKPSAAYFRVGRSLEGTKLALNIEGTTVPSSEDECQEILQHIPDELTEGAAARLYLKDNGQGDYFGAYTSEFALDLFVAEVPGFPEPVPVATTGWIIQTQEDGSKTFWSTQTEFQPDASATVRSEILWGTDRYEGVSAIVAGVSVPKDPENPTESPYRYNDHGWIRF